MRNIHQVVIYRCIVLIGFLKVAKFQSVKNKRDKRLTKCVSPPGVCMSADTLSWEKRCKDTNKLEICKKIAKSFPFHPVYTGGKKRARLKRLKR